MSPAALYLWLVLILFGGCLNRPHDDNVHSIFLEGTWVMAGNGDPEKRFIEEWIFENDSALAGSGYLLNSTTGDSFLTEQLWLKRNNHQWSYMARPAGNDAPIVFRATEENDTILMFENPAHDFPQFIRYELIASDSLLVTVGDTSRSNSWKMVRY